MKSNTLSAACALIFACVASGASAQSTEPKFPVESVPVPAGKGMPGDKPIDIRGLHAGMTSEAAVAVLREHYKTVPKNKLNIRMSSLRYAAGPFVMYAANAIVGESPYFDYVGAAFTSNANGNQVVAIASETRYAPGKEANAGETLAAIIKKYGEPSMKKDVGGLKLIYAYKNGEIVPEKNVCSFHQADVSLSDPGVSMQDQWYSRLVSVISGDDPRAFPPEVTGCTAILYITIGYATHAGQTNKNAIARLNIAFFDAARFRAALQRDQLVQKELNEKAKGAAPGGSGASKL